MSKAGDQDFPLVGRFLPMGDRLRNGMFRAEAISLGQAGLCEMKIGIVSGKEIQSVGPHVLPRLRR